MIKRIVKLTFRTEHIEDFKLLFQRMEQKISSFAGCQHLELWQSVKDDRVFFTYSWWENEQSLEEYRHSEFFKTTWANTKIFFDDKPEAWSVNEIFPKNR